MKPERCKTCHSNLLYPNPEGCWECNPKVLGEKYEALREEHSGCDGADDWCPVCSGDCNDCSEKDEEIAELREAADKYKAEAMNMAALLEARSDLKTRRDWAKFARERLEAVEHPAAVDVDLDVSKLRAGRRSDADVSHAGEG